MYVTYYIERVLFRVQSATSSEGSRPGPEAGKGESASNRDLADPSPRRDGGLVEGGGWRAGEQGRGSAATASSSLVVAEVPRRTSKFPMTSVREGRIQKRHVAMAAAAAAKAMKAASKQAEAAERNAPKDALIQAKMASYDDPQRTLTISYDGIGGRLWTEDEDRFLFCTTAELGYGNWKQVQRAVQRCSKFRQNWLFRARSPAELGHRVDLLIGLVRQEHRAAE